MAVERSLILLKPDAVRRGLIGEIISRYESKGLAIRAMSMRTIDKATSDRHYESHVWRDFYPPLRDFMLSGPLVAMVVEGDGALGVLRDLHGATDARVAAPGTIRGDLGLSNRENLVHASDSNESAKKEIAEFFPDFAL